jgi:hypothetical protein
VANRTLRLEHVRHIVARLLGSLPKEDQHIFEHDAELIQHFNDPTRFSRAFICTRHRVLAVGCHSL